MSVFYLSAEIDICKVMTKPAKKSYNIIVKEVYHLKFKLYVTTYMESTV